MQVENGEATQRKKYKEANAWLQNIVGNYNSDDKLSLLKYISHNLNYYNYSFLHILFINIISLILSITIKLRMMNV